MKPPALVRRVIVGTAGHIDHGKTTLVERLTGVRTDRLPEEQARGMTIDVGYAEHRLPDGTEVGLIDVPGHERLVRTMVAGAVSMDLVLLVVAADDGVMPQTREHLDILDLLGVRRALVALTKVDLVPPERVAVVADQVRAALAGTGLGAAPILPVSSVTGQGLEQLRAALARAVPEADARAADPRAFRMSILRGFSAPGRGTVVTGIPTAGRVLVGEEVEVLPVGVRGRVRGIQVHHRGADAAGEGQRTALLVPELPVEGVERGMVVAHAGGLAAAEWLAARLRVLRHVRRPLRHASAVRLHVGAGDHPARLHLLGARTLGPGEEAAVHLQGLAPLLVGPGDRFVLRSENSADTIAGGVVVRRLARRPGRRELGYAAEVLEQSARLADPAALTLDALRDAGRQGTDAAALAVATGLRPGALRTVLDELVLAGRVVRTPRGRLFEAAGFRALADQVLEALARLHALDPGLPAVALTALRAALASVPAAAVEAALEALAAQGRLRREGQAAVARSDHAAALPRAHQAAYDRVLAVLRAAGGMPPRGEALAEAAGLRPAEVRHALQLLEARREVFRAADLCFDAAWVEQAQGALRALAAQGGFRPSQACQALAITRRFGLPLLEALDRRGFTRRVGDLRVVT